MQRCDVADGVHLAPDSKPCPMYLPDATVLAGKQFGEINIALLRGDIFSCRQGGPTEFLPSVRLQAPGSRLQAPGERLDHAKARASASFAHVSDHGVVILHELASYATNRNFTIHDLVQREMRSKEVRVSTQSNYSVHQTRTPVHQPKRGCKR